MAFTMVFASQKLLVICHLVNKISSPCQLEPKNVFEKFPSGWPLKIGPNFYYDFFAPKKRKPLGSILHQVLGHKGHRKAKFFLTYFLPLITTFGQPSLKLVNPGQRQGQTKAMLAMGRDTHADCDK